MLKLCLEYAAFGGSLFSVWLYGKSQTKGPIAGITVSLLFMLYGIIAGVYAAALSNIVFLMLHINNYRKGRNMDWNRLKAEMKKDMGWIVRKAHELSYNAGWWNGMPISDFKVIATKISLIHSEISEALEGHRKGKQDEHLPHRLSIEVELGDAVIRIFDLAGAMGLDLPGAIAEKMEYNATRPDHRPENREKPGGKKY
jgi:NTP pyrophosphatase (non-canonical NTP hydrolase)